MNRFGDASLADREVPGAAGRDGVLLAARLLAGLIFVVSGFGKLAGLGGFTAGMAGRGVPLAEIAAPLGVAAEFVGGLALLAGAWTRWAALALAVFTVAATLIAHRFWAFPPDEQMMQTTQFLKNLAIIGGLLALYVAGGGRLGVDGFRAGR
ncbi:MAG TPA: DoxX family protein [Geminicoccus sp.]|jgi:putative oxidoreductase|uniref:DoxX family protein n=1 Tax=Geminicoccus sp. TaxID=2024832 RepID=UPI002E33B292|nr:DoxX family protein [Geminicoccus sp.]HEX2528627.1 DoxX family protein [Geminicoccus sp.]